MLRKIKPKPSPYRNMLGSTSISTKEIDEHPVFYCLESPMKLCPIRLPLEEDFILPKRRTQLSSIAS
jgi:hypothetical protein